MVSPQPISDERDFLQQRVVLYSRVGAILLGVMFVVDIITFPLLSPKLNLPGLGRAQFWGAAGEALAVFLLALASWLAGRGAPGKRALYVIDGLTTVVVCGALSIVILHAPPVPLPLEWAIFIMIQALLFLHAALVPAPAIRTAAIHMLACVPLFFIAQHRAFGSDPPTSLWWIHVYSIPVWAIIFAVVGAVTSHLLYRLEVRVREARKLGQYQLEEKLGEGGMGVVYRAQHAMLRRPTAIKILPADRAGEVAIERFEREVRNTSRLSHPNTVAIFDFGRTPEGLFYYAMELLDGLTLNQIVEVDGPLESSRVIHVLRQCAGALTEAHQLGLVHRDVKPENIVMCERGGVLDTVKVVDYGLVKDLKLPKEVAVSQAESILGTPLYMAPEALTRPDKVDGRADLYALGAVGYYLLTGAPPFAGTSVVEVCAKHLDTAPQPPSERLGAPIALDVESIIMKLLEKDPEARFGTSSELEAALAQCADAGRWTRRDAQEWWQKHQHVVERERAGQPVPSGHVLEVVRRGSS